MHGYLMVTLQNSVSKKIRWSRCKIWDMGAILLTWLIALPKSNGLQSGLPLCSVYVNTEWLWNESMEHPVQCSVYFITEWLVAVKIIEAIQSNRQGSYNTVTSKYLKFNTLSFSIIFYGTMLKSCVLFWGTNTQIVHVTTALPGQVYWRQIRLAQCCITQKNSYGYIPKYIPMSCWYVPTYFALQRCLINRVIHQLLFFVFSLLYPFFSWFKVSESPWEHVRTIC